MIKKITIENALSIIENSNLFIEDEIIPKNIPHISNSPYKPEYDWLFIYERKIMKFLTPWLESKRYQLIGEKGILCEALSNAFYHGNKKDSFKSIILRIYFGKYGLIIQIEDSGTGFNVEEIHYKFKKKKNYFHSAGNGFKLMDSSEKFIVFYNINGNIFNLLYLFNENINSIETNKINSVKTTNNTFPKKKCSENPIYNENLFYLNNVVLKENKNLIFSLFLDSNFNFISSYKLKVDNISNFILKYKKLLLSINKLLEKLEFDSFININIEYKSKKKTIMSDNNYILISDFKKEIPFAIAKIKSKDIFKYFISENILLK